MLQSCKINEAKGANKEWKIHQSDRIGVVYAINWKKRQ
jgi:hypothetical protein